jgi:hypothetical protein
MPECPQLDFEGSSSLTMLPVTPGAMKVGQPVKLTATVQNDGTANGSGFVTFYWQQYGTAIFTQIVAQAPALNPVAVPILGPAQPGTVGSVWVLDDQTVGPGPFAHGYLYATVSTTAGLNCEGINLKQPVENPKYPGPTASTGLLTILNLG